MGLDRIGASFRRRLPGSLLANMAHVWQSTFLFTIGHQKKISARHYLEIARNYIPRLFSKKCKFLKSVSVSGDNLGPTSLEHLGKSWKNARKEKFSELGLPGVEMVNGLCRIFFDYARPPQLPYNEKSETCLENSIFI